MNPDDVAREVAAALRAMGDPKKAEGLRRFFKEPIDALGIDTPTLRKFGAQRVSVLKGKWSAAEAVRGCEQLLGEPEIEIRGMGLLLLTAFQEELTPAFLRRAERWLTSRVDNWALVDSMCGMILSPLMEREPEAVSKTLVKWSGAKGLWVRRASLVTLVPMARRGRHLDLAYRLATEHLEDAEDLMHKATGWLLREAGKTDAGRLKSYLLDHGPAVPRTALRYAIERFPAAERRRLLAATRA